MANNIGSSIQLLFNAKDSLREVSYYLNHDYQKDTKKLNNIAELNIEFNNLKLTEFNDNRNKFDEIVNIVKKQKYITDCYNQFLFLSMKKKKK